MALQRGESIRQDLRLDTFLRRQLSQEDYERVSGAESCVVFTPEERKVHRYVILGHRQLYSTEFAPKKLKVLLQLDSITDVQILHDLPDFLSGEEQQNTVHLQIHFRRSSPVKDKHFFRKQSAVRPLPSPPPNSNSEGNSPVEGKSPGSDGQPSPPPPSRGSFLLRQHSTSPNLISTPHPEGGSPSPPGKLFVTRSNLEITHHSPKGAGGCDDQESPLTPRFSKELPPIRKSSEGVKSKRLPPTIMSRFDSSTSTSSMQQLPVLQHLGAKDKATSQPDLYTASTKEGGGARSGAGPHRSTSTEVISMRSLGVTSPTSSGPIGASMDSFLQLPSLPTTSASMGDLSSKSRPFMSRRSPLQMSASLTDLYLHPKGCPHKVGVVEEQPKLQLPTFAGTEAAVVDIYVLKQVTNFGHLLKATWLDVEIDRVFQLSASSSVLVPTSPKPYDQFSQQFCALKKEIFASGNMQTTASLAQELSTASQKYFYIKKMFWEDSELLEYFSEAVKTCLSRKNLRRLSQSFDHYVEYVMIILELLYNMLKEGHTLRAKKLAHLTSNGGHTLFLLAETLLGGFPLLMHCGQAQKVEFTEKVCEVLYMLVSVLEQSLWPSTITSTTTITISYFVESLIINMRDFMQGLLHYIISAIETLQLTPSLVVGVYHASVVLHAFITSSPTITHFVRKHFMEEFKYYMNIYKGEQKFPGQARIIKIALQKLKACKSRVLSPK